VPRAKITADIVEAVRRDYLEGNETMAELGHKYGATEDIVKAAIILRAWRHIPVPNDYAARLDAARRRRRRGRFSEPKGA
jgi:hypothetical protein